MAISLHQGLHLCPEGQGNNLGSKHYWQNRAKLAGLCLGNPVQGSVNLALGKPLCTSKANWCAVVEVTVCGDGVMSDRRCQVCLH